MEPDFAQAHWRDIDVEWLNASVEAVNIKRRQYRILKIRLGIAFKFLYVKNKKSIAKFHLMIKAYAYHAI